MNKVKTSYFKIMRDILQKCRIGVVVFIFLVGAVVWLTASHQRLNQRQAAPKVTTLEKVVQNATSSNAVLTNSTNWSHEEALPRVKPMPVALGGGMLRQLEERSEAVASAADRDAAAQAASELNQTMDALLNRAEIPSDYGARMVALVRDKAQDELTRDFAVQHLGLYAQSLARRGTYDPSGREADTLRKTLSEAAHETRSIVAAAAFRALADIAVFDDRVDVRNLDLQLADCVADSSAAPAARTMAIQLCGERGIRRAIPNLTRICRDATAGTTQRLAAEAALRQLTGEPSFQHMKKGVPQ